MSGFKGFVRYFGLCYFFYYTAKDKRAFLALNSSLVIKRVFTYKFLEAMDISLKVEKYPIKYRKKI